MARDIWKHLMGDNNANYNKGKQNKTQISNRKEHGWRADIRSNGVGRIAEQGAPLQQYESNVQANKNTTSFLPLYPLLFILVMYNFLNRIFSYRHRTRIIRKLEATLGNKKFSVSQEELTRHIDLLAKRNMDMTGRGSNDVNRCRTIIDGNGDAAGGFSSGRSAKTSSSNPSERSSNISFESTPRAMSTSPKQFSITKRELLLYDRGCSYTCKKHRKEDECRKALLENEMLKEKVRSLESECADAYDTAQNLAEKLVQAKKQEESWKRLHGNVVTSKTKLKESLKESEAKVAQLKNENIVLNSVIARLEEENNEMGKFIEEACRSGSGDVDIEEIDLDIVSSTHRLSEESLTMDENESITSQQLKLEEENAKLRAENEFLFFVMNI